jgi:hypothetical protein
MRNGRVFFLDLLVVFVISIILIISAVVLVKNWNYIVVENTIGRLTDSLALDISENLINSPLYIHKLFTELWKRSGDPLIPGLAALDEREGVRNYVLELAGRDVNYSISVREIDGSEWTLLDQNTEPEIRTSVVRRLVMIDDEGVLKNGLLEVMVIV